jgi:hypothetical protein
MSSRMVRKLVLWGSTVLVLTIGLGIVKASDPLDGAKDFDAIGVGQPARIPTCPASGAFITDNGTLRGEPVGNAQYQLLIPACVKAPAGGGIPGELILTKDDGSTLVMDIAVTTPDSGVTYQGTYSAPSYNGFTSAVSLRKFQGVFGVGNVAFGTGLNPNTAAPANAPTLHVNGTLVFPN